MIDARRWRLLLVVLVAAAALAPVHAFITTPLRPTIARPCTMRTPRAGIDGADGTGGRAEAGPEAGPDGSGDVDGAPQPQPTGQTDQGPPPSRQASFSGLSDGAITKSLQARVAELKIAPVIDANEARQRYYSAFLAARRKAVVEKLDQAARATGNRTVLASAAGAAGGAGGEVEGAAGGAAEAGSTRLVAARTVSPRDATAVIAAPARWSPASWAWAVLLACSCYSAQECTLTQLAMGQHPSFNVGSAEGLGLLTSVLFGATSLAILFGPPRDL